MIETCSQFCVIYLYNTKYSYLIKVRRLLNAVTLCKIESWATLYSPLCVVLDSKDQRLKTGKTHKGNKDYPSDFHFGIYLLKLLQNSKYSFRPGSFL